MEKAENIVKVEEQKFVLDSQEKEDMLSFLRNTARVPESIVTILSKVDSQIRELYDVELEKWKRTSTDYLEVELKEHEKKAQEKGDGLLDNNLEKLEDFVSQSIGMSNTKLIAYTQRLADGRRLPVVIKATRIVPIASEKIKIPQDIRDAIKKDMVDNLNLKTTIKLAVARKKTITVTEKKKLESGAFEYVVQFAPIRDASEKEKKEDAQKAQEKKAQEKKAKK